MLAAGALSLAACAPRATAPAPAAQASATPAPGAWAPLLERVNAARRAGADCGERGVYGPAAPVAWNARLATAAQTQSDDMAERGFFSHTGSDGSQAGLRAERAGYAWSVIGETLAYATPGYFTPRSVIEAWLGSPGHCATLLEPDFRELGAARSEGELEYWAVVLGAPPEGR